VSDDPQRVHWFWGKGGEREWIVQWVHEGKKVASNFAGQFLAVRPAGALAWSREYPSPPPPPPDYFMYKGIRTMIWASKGTSSAGVDLFHIYIASCSINAYARLITFGPNKPFGRPSSELAGDSPFVAIIAFFSMDCRIGFVMGIW
jgi:hypothetical protein